MNRTIKKRKVNRMAGEFNHTIVLLHNDNEVEEKQACPKCGNDNMNTMEIDVS